MDKVTIVQDLVKAQGAGQEISDETLQGMSYGLTYGDFTSDDMIDCPADWREILEGLRARLQEIETADKVTPRPMAYTSTNHCRRCRQSEADGAMFTTDPESRICDDCY